MADYRSNIKDEVEVTPYRKIQNGSITGDMVKDRTITKNKLAEGVIPPINNKHNYSTTEQVVGTWIDGKPIYEKCIEIRRDRFDDSYNVFSNLVDDVSVIPSDVEQIVRVEAFDTTEKSFYSAYGANVNNTITVAKSDDNVTYVSMFLLQYTKTTDVPNT